MNSHISTKSETLDPEILYPYQKKAIEWQCTHPASALWLDCGLGKTVITLTSLSHLISTGFLKGVVIVAPIRVIRLVWRQEALKWSHTKDLTFSMVAGTRDQRTRALLRDADIYLLNYENLRWFAETVQTYFVKRNKPVPFNGIVWDELSKMKNSTTQRVKSYMKIADHFHWSTGLTGTPASNGYKDLHGQFLVLDRGVRLGTSKTAFRQRFYRKVGPYIEVPYDDTESTIKRLIGDITLEMSAEDYNPLPDMMVNDVMIELDKPLRDKYERMEREFFLQLDSGDSKEVFNQASLTNACLQFSNGAIYPVAGMPLWERIHDLKLDALEDIIEEAQGQPILLAYAYRSDAQRIMERFKNLSPINLTECKSEKSLHEAMRRWKENECPLMIGHPACLHPWTEVLTQRNGWVRLIDVDDDDLVFDGVEFVCHDGVRYSGHKEVIDLFGITLTPDHKLLINGEWMEARDVKDHGISRNEAVFQWETPVDCESKVLKMRTGVRTDASKRSKAQSGTTGVLSALRGRQVPQDDRHPHLENLARSQMESKGFIRSQLWWSWNRGVRAMGQLRELLQGYVGRLLGRFNHRAHRCEWSLLQRELQVGYEYGAAIQQANQSLRRVPRGDDSFSRAGASIRVQQNDVIHEAQPWDDCGRSGGELQKFSLREEQRCQEQTQTRKTAVYDIVNCGPRHRFLIRNDQGEMFISHNSMGHGVDGLQKNGHILVWFGLNWSLDLYEQFNARIRRQGQGAPVICHRILTVDTLDQAQALSLDEKAQTQSELRSAIKQYRLQKTSH